MKMPRRLVPIAERFNRFLKEWEWTWTTAVVFSVALTFGAIIVLAVIPSFWLYFADQVLQWKSFWLVKLKEAIAAGWITVNFALFFLVAYLMQKQRQKVRGTGGGTRPVGGYK
jgi:hypothetical protein